MKLFGAGCTGKQGAITFAHVWYQIYDKQGKAYVVEGFSKDLERHYSHRDTARNRERTPTLILRHNLVRQALEGEIAEPEDSRGGWIRIL